MELLLIIIIIELGGLLFLNYRKPLKHTRKTIIKPKIVPKKVQHIEKPILIEELKPMTQEEFRIKQESRIRPEEPTIEELMKRT